MGKWCSAGEYLWYPLQCQYGIELLMWDQLLPHSHLFIGIFLTVIAVLCYDIPMNTVIDICRNMGNRDLGSKRFAVFQF